MERMRNGGEKRVVGKGRVQLEAKRADGSIFPVELAVQSAVTEDGGIFIAFLRDITQQKADEAELGPVDNHRAAMIVAQRYQFAA
jgi:PAS domain S-box-containing protein